jgi:hypothetical protein
MTFIFPSFSLYVAHKLFNSTFDSNNCYLHLFTKKVSHYFVSPFLSVCFFLISVCFFLISVCFFLISVCFFFISFCFFLISVCSPFPLFHFVSVCSSFSLFISTFYVSVSFYSLSFCLSFPYVSFSFSLCVSSFSLSLSLSARFSLPSVCFAYLFLPCARSNLTQQE